MFVLGLVSQAALILVISIHKTNRLSPEQGIYDIRHITQNWIMGNDVLAALSYSVNTGRWRALAFDYLQSDLNGTGNFIELSVGRNTDKDSCCPHYSILTSRIQLEFGSY